MDELYSKVVPVNIRKTEREERLQSIGVCILLNVINSPVHKKELILRLTDETDPFFLYSLTLSEDDFQSLKNQQGLLVDFSSFPQKLIDLFELCLKESTNEHPKFCLQLYLPNSTSSPSLQVIETNLFRHLTHISLKLIPANDAYLKKYLAQSILTLKEHNETIEECLSQTKSDLSAQLLHTQELLSSRSKELERMKSDWAAEITAINNKHSAAMNEEKEKAMRVQQNLQSRLDNVKKEQETLYHKRVDGLEEKLQEIDKTNKELTDHKYRCEAAIRELKAKLKGTDEELVDTRDELTRVRKENAGLESELHKKEKTVNHLQTRVAVLEQEIKDKTQISNQTGELLEKANEQKQSYEVQLEQKHRQVVKLDTAFRQTSQEVAKGNEIIAKLQSDVKTIKSKLALRNAVITQQEKVINDKDIETAKLSSELKSLNNDLVKKGAETASRQETIERLEAEIAQLKENLKTSENVVTWLNKQVNDQMLTKGRFPIAPSSLTRGTTLEPLSIIKGPYSTIASSGGSYRPQFSSTPASAGSTVVSGPNTPTGPSDSNNLRPAVLTLEQQQHQKVLFRGPTKGFNPMTKASPLSTHTHSSAPIATPTSALQKEPFIDPKYLPPELPKEIKENVPLASNYLPK